MGIRCNTKTEIKSSAFSSLAIFVVVVVIALATTNALSFVDAFQSVNKSLSLSLSTRTISKINIESSHTITRPITHIIDIEERKNVVTTSTTTTTTNTILFMAPHKNKKKNVDEGNSDDTNTSTSPFLENIKNAKPGTLIILPFVALFGIDLLLNILVITKRSIEYFVFGEVPSIEPWW
ncbi:hypothetical protein FRACYDRAFT_267431 [Fragilariopsis cylindrus CCMP1102]|uniref:Transmembrane protein n=1 Tax=Fragilariopsis cylindrus CCMP1102 TaxID=635003 RepID=A0A1E7FXT1_9STRA|nr:hypothetical protein FRACYDRAFT_267431 [Fragilariopsis cylindrus CCMP1102]|eukprot:OEU22961.1 hypothetical protein FRACYDRAFT_267431 [Fragilariopsis cylindrus CCMP1102]